MEAPLFDRIKKVRASLAERIAHPIGTGETLAHGAYFAFVFIEGHSIYAIIAGVLCLIVIIRIVIVGLME